MQNVAPRLAHPRALLILALALFAAAAAMRPAHAGKEWFAAGGLLGSSAAVRGYDVVAYFTDGRPVEGKGEHKYTWQGTEWRFASAKNRDTFAASPEKYAPQYGGYCAWAVAQGYSAPTDPDAWKIVEGRLYLNYSKSIQEKWATDIPGNIKKADGNWPGIRTKLASE